MKKLLFGVALCLLCISTISQATPITGDQIGDGSDWTVTVPSTNADNYATGSRLYVLFDSNDVGSVTLDFYSKVNWAAYFEIRIDGAASTTGTPNFNANINGDVYPYFKAAANSSITETINASEYVDVRSTFGAESDYFFDWTRFYVASAGDTVPEPATLLLLGFGLLGVAGVSRRKN